VTRTTRHARTRRTRRGSILLVVIVGLLVLAVFAANFASQAATDSHESTQQWQVVRALYAAESGIAMAIQEVIRDTDVDGDGGVGTIAERAIGDLPGVTVSVIISGDGEVLTATGKAADTERQVEVQIQ